MIEKVFTTIFIIAMSMMLIYPISRFLLKVIEEKYKPVDDAQAQKGRKQ